MIKGHRRFMSCCTAACQALGRLAGPLLVCRLPLALQLRPSPDHGHARGAPVGAAYPDPAGPGPAMPFPGHHSGLAQAPSTRIPIPAVAVRTVTPGHLHQPDLGLPELRARALAIAGITPHAHGTRMTG